MSIPQLPREIINDILYKYKGFSPYPFHKEFHELVDLVVGEMEENECGLSEEEMGSLTLNILMELQNGFGVNGGGWWIQRERGWEEREIIPDARTPYERLIALLPDFF